MTAQPSFNFEEMELKQNSLKILITKIRNSEFEAKSPSDMEDKYELLRAELEDIFHTKGNGRAEQLFNTLVNMSWKRLDNDQIAETEDNQEWVVEAYNLLVELVKG